MGKFKEFLKEDRAGVKFLQIKTLATKIADELSHELCSVEIIDHKKEEMVRLEIKTCGDAKAIKNIEKQVTSIAKKSSIDAHISVQLAGKIKVLLSYKQE